MTQDQIEDLRTQRDAAARDLAAWIARAAIAQRWSTGRADQYAQYAYAAAADVASLDIDIRIATGR